MSIVITVVIIAIVVIWAIVAYNGLISLRNRVDQSWAQISVQLQRRSDLIPNLAETVKGYAQHESSVFSAITTARADASRAAQSGSVSDAQAAESSYRTARLAINAVAEAYPDLKASQNYSQLQEELASTENRVAASRQFYNEAVQLFNTKIESVPTNIVASLGHFTQRESFDVEDESVRKAPKLSFSS